MFYSLFYRIHQIWPFVYILAFLLVFILALEKDKPSYIYNYLISCVIAFVLWISAELFIVQPVQHTKQTVQLDQTFETYKLDTIVIEGDDYNYLTANEILEVASKYNFKLKDISKMRSKYVIHTTYTYEKQ